MNSPSNNLLPHPDDHPQSEVIIYDGHCQFCSKQTERVARWDRRGKLAFLSLHDPEVATRYPDLTREQLLQAMYLIDHRGKRYAGAAAFRYLAAKIPRLWILLPLLHVPFSLPLWQWMYRQVAKRRYRWNKDQVCDDDECSIHFR